MKMFLFLFPFIQHRKSPIPRTSTPIPQFPDRLPDPIPKPQHFKTAKPKSPYWDTYGLVSKPLHTPIRTTYYQTSNNGYIEVNEAQMLNAEYFQKESRRLSKKLMV